MKLSSTKRVLITGVSRGIGKSIAELLIKNKYKVIGTCRDPGKIPETEKVPGVEYIPLELTDAKSIDHVIKKTGDIDILINNAGVSQIGPAEEIEFSQVKYLFDLNYFGPLKLIQKILPSMRLKRNGTIINISSLAAAICIPFSSVYVSTKAALEAFSKTLRNEVMPFNIKVVCVAPSYIKTTIPQKMSLKQGSIYTGALLHVKLKRKKMKESSPGAGIVAKKVLHILKKRNPKPRYVVGKGTFFITLFLKFLPEKLVQNIIRNIYISKKISNY